MTAAGGCRAMVLSWFTGHESELVRDDEADRHLRRHRVAHQQLHASDGNCVEVATIADGPAVAVRDTKDRAAGHTAISPDAWTAFINAAKSGAFNA
ncbi:MULTISPECIES: DUF397 domain-containing protein [Streptomyces]|uniref:DUF397 domain-containing protein n=1 Tax=Streptomyces TaxID=1883 RepID=UPI001D0496DE|nr:MULTISPECIES: DUF397 domain-containing protein [Streptomyces]